MALSKDLETFTYHVLRDPLWETKEALDKAHEWLLQSYPNVNERRKHETRALTFFRAHFDAFTRVTVIEDKARERILAIGRAFCADDEATLYRRFCAYPDYLSLTQYCRDVNKSKNEEDRDHIFAAYTAFFPLTVFCKFRHEGVPVIEIYALSEDSIPAIRTKLVWIATVIFALPLAEELVRTHFLIALDDATFCASHWGPCITNIYTGCRPSGLAIEIPRNDHLPMADTVADAFIPEKVDVITALLPAFRAPLDADDEVDCVSLFPQAASLARAERIRLFRDDVLQVWLNRKKPRRTTPVEVAQRHLCRAEQLAKFLMLDIHDEDVAACFEVHDRPLPPWCPEENKTLVAHAECIAIEEFQMRYFLCGRSRLGTGSEFFVPLDCLLRANKELDEICAYVAAAYSLDPIMLRSRVTVSGLM